MNTRRADTPRASYVQLVALNKPFGVVCQFSPLAGLSSLAQFAMPKGVYPAGRLDADSEGLVLLTSDGTLQHEIAHPGGRLEKRYWVQVEGQPDHQALRRLEGGLDLGDFVSRPCNARLIDAPALVWPRVPPIRYRRTIPTSWIEVCLKEGKNRQIRRMTAQVGFPTLRLIRHSIGPFNIDALAPGTWRAEEPAKLSQALKST